MGFYVLLNCLICQGWVKTSHLILHSISLYRGLIKCIRLGRNNQLQSFSILIISVKFFFFLEELIFTRHTFLIILYFHFTNFLIFSVFALSEETYLRSLIVMICTFYWHCPWCPLFISDPLQFVSVFLSFIPIIEAYVLIVRLFVVLLVLIHFHVKPSPTFFSIFLSMLLGSVYIIVAIFLFIQFP